MDGRMSGRVRVSGLVLAVSMIAVLPGSVSAAEHTTESVAAVKQKVESGQAVLLDVREVVEWDEGHLKRAKLLPLSQIRKGVPDDELAKLIKPGTVVYAHCRSGGRCLEATDRLRRLGFKVEALKPGYSDLLKAGFEPSEPESE